MRLRVSSSRFGVLLVATALLLSVLTLGNSGQAAAQATCDVGALEDDRCVEIGDAPAPAGDDVCPTTEAVFEDAAGCYELVPRVGGDTCPTGSTPAPDGQQCRIAVDKVVVSTDCPAGFTIGVPEYPDLDRCAAIDAPAQSDPTCLPPARGTAADCYTVRLPALTCAAGMLGGDVCVIEGPPPVVSPSTNPDDPFPLPGPLVCTLGFGLVGSDCLRYEVPIVDITAEPCPGIVEDSGLCRVPAPLRQPELQCGRIGEVLTGTDCVLTIEVASGCPTGFVLDDGDTCVQVTDATQRDDECPAGSRGLTNGCYILVAKGPAQASECVTGVPAGDTCVITGTPPTQNEIGQLFCEAGFVPSRAGLDDVGSCIRFEDPIQFAPQCPAGSVQTVEGYCSKPVANARGAYLCESPFQLLLAKTCTISTNTMAVVENACPVNFIAGIGSCVRSTPAPLSDLGCPPNALGTAGSCFIYVADAGPTCAEGQPTLDATKCFVFVRFLPNGGEQTCPAGYEVDDALGFCARFEPATPGGETCPEGARGVVDACYILVAKGPGGVPVCAEGVLEGNACAIEGNPPVSIAGGSCPDDALLEADFCYRLVADPIATFVCTTDGTGDHDAGPYLFDVDANVCRFSVPVEQAADFPGGNYICPAAFDGVTSVQGDYERDGDAANEIAGYCTLNGKDLDVCITPDVADGNGCRREVPLVGGTLGCAPAYGLIGGRCIRYEDPVQSASQCPQGSLEDEAGDCRKPVANATAPFVCEDVDAALNGEVCVFTAGFITTPRYVCDQGELVETDNQGPICIVGDPIPATQPCPAGAQLQADGQCTRLIGDAIGSFYCEDAAAIQLFRGCLLFPELQRCPSAYSPDFSLGEQCARFELATEAADGSFFCQDPTASLNRQSCVFVTDYINDNTQVSQCPDRAGVVADGDSCFELVSFERSVCPADTDEVDASSLCRKVVLREQQPLVCAANYELAGDRCVRYSPASGVADLDCADTGVGTAACDQVIGTSQSTPAGVLVSGRATKVAFAACAGGTGTFTVTSNGVTVTGGALSESPAGQYSGSYTLAVGGTYVVEAAVDCPGGSSAADSDVLAFLDPSGIVTDCVGDPVAGATVTLLRSSTAQGTPVVVADGDASIMDPGVNTANPSVTNAQGFYRWDVVEGFYQVSVSVDGQATVTSGVVAVPPERTDLDLVLASLNCATPTTEPTAVPTVTPAPRATVVPTTATNSTSAGSPVRPVGPSQPLIAPAQSAALAVSQPTPSTSPQSPLAITGTEAPTLVTLAIGLMGAGAALQIATRRHRRADLFVDERRTS